MNASASNGSAFPFKQPFQFQPPPPSYEDHIYGEPALFSRNRRAIIALSLWLVLLLFSLIWKFVFAFFIVGGYEWSDGGRERFCACLLTGIASLFVLHQVLMLLVVLSHKPALFGNGLRVWLINSWTWSSLLNATLMSAAYIVIRNSPHVPITRYWLTYVAHGVQVILLIIEMMMAKGWLRVRGIWKQELASTYYRRYPDPEEYCVRCYAPYRRLEKRKLMPA